MAILFLSVSFELANVLYFYETAPPLSTLAISLIAIAFINYITLQSLTFYLSSFKRCSQQSAYFSSERVYPAVSREKGCRSGESTCLPPIWPKLGSQTRRHIWVEFVASVLCFKRFSPGSSIWYVLIWFDLCSSSPISASAINTLGT